MAPGGGGWYNAGKLLGSLTASKRVKPAEGRRCPGVSNAAAEELPDSRPWKAGQGCLTKPQVRARGRQRPFDYNRNRKQTRQRPGAIRVRVRAETVG